MEMTYGKNIKKNENIQLDRRNLSNGGHMLIIGDTGMGKTFFIKKEMVQILKETNDVIYIFTRNYWEYEALSTLKCQNMIYGKQNSYDEILKHGKKLLLNNQRLWVYFDQYFSDCASNEWNEFQNFVRDARKAGIIITISAQDFSGIPHNILVSFLSCLECCQFFCTRKNTSEILGLFVDDSIELVFMQEYLRNCIPGNGIFYSKKTDVIPISCRMKDPFLHNFLTNPTSKKDGFILGTPGAEKTFFCEKETLVREGKKIYSKEELEQQLDPAACKIPKEECPKGQDIVQVTLPWLNDANDCIEVYLVRKEDGTIGLEYD